MLEEELALQRRDNDRLTSRLRRFRAEVGDLGRARSHLAGYAERINEAENRTMLAHIRISQGESSPRLHFLDDTRDKTGKIHIGYIGPHLPTARDPK